MRTKKALLTALCAVLLVVTSVMGTLAYLTSTDEVKNTFTVGNVTITMDEADVDLMGIKTSNPRDKENAYHLLPGHIYTKDPTIHVDANSESCYLFVKIVNEIAEIEATGNTTVAAQMEAKGWKVVDAANGIYVYAANDSEKTAVAAGTDVKVFENFTLKGAELNNDNLDDYQGKTIVVTAYAIQVDGFEDDTAADIWAAYGESNPTTAG